MYKKRHSRFLWRKRMEITLHSIYAPEKRLLKTDYLITRFPHSNPNLIWLLIRLFIDRSRHVKTEIHKKEIKPNSRALTLCRSLGCRSLTDRHFRSFSSAYIQEYRGKEKMIIAPCTHGWRNKRFLKPFTFSLHFLPALII